MHQTSAQMNSERKENKMFGFKTEEEKFKLADYDRMKKELETTQQSLVNCEKALKTGLISLMIYKKKIVSCLQKICNIIKMISPVRK